MADIQKDGKQIWGSNGEHGYDEGNRISYNGKTYYKDGKSFYCPDDGKTYHTDGYNV